jgi:hypothetical protein
MKKATISEIESSLKNGDIAKLKKWVSYGQKFKRTRFNLTTGNNLALRKAAEHGHLDIVKWLVDECGQKDWPVKHTFLKNVLRIDVSLSAAYIAAGCEHYDIAKWLFQHPTYNVPEAALLDMLLTMISACENDLDVEFFKWLLGYSLRCLKLETLDVLNIFRFITAFGTFEMIKWTITDSGLIIDVTDHNYRAIVFAITASNRAKERTGEEAKWLIEESGLVIDCRDCENWSEFNVLYDSKAEENKEFIRSVKRFQEAIGLAGYEKALALKDDRNSNKKARVV